MGDGSGAACAPPGRARALWLKLWSNRTKLIGYFGVIAAAVQMAIIEGQHWQLLLLGALVAAIGHYNDQQVGQP